MSRAGVPVNDENEVELLTLGPFGGLDLTTAPYYVAPTNFVDGENFVPNNNYGGYSTALGRDVALLASLPSAPNGIFKLTRPNQVDIYLFAVDVGGVGAIYQGQIGGTATPLTLPAPLTPGQQTFFAEALKWVFVTNGVDRPIKIDTNLAVTYWGIVAPTVAPTLAPNGAGGEFGTYYYAITYATADQESSQGTISAPITVANQGIQLTGIPVSTDPQVTERNIYRIGGALGQWRLVATLNDNTTTTYLDTLADINVTGQSLTVRRDPPPPFKAITAHKERIWGFNTPTDTSQLWHSNYGEPWGFDSVDGTNPVGENSFGDEGVNLCSIGSVLFLAKTRSSYAVYGTTDADFQVTKLFDIGCIAPLSLVTAYGQCAWLSNQGVWTFNGGQPTQISDGAYQISNIKKALDALPASEKAQAVGFVYDRMYHLSLPTASRTYFYDLRSSQWFSLGWFCTQAIFDLEDPQYPVIAGNAMLFADPGQITTWFQGPTDLGNPITSFLLSRITDSDKLPANKTYRYLLVEAPPQPGATCNVYVYVNPGNLQYQDAFPIDLGQQGTKKQVSLPFTFVGVEIQMQLQIIGSIQTVVHKAGIYGRVNREFIPETTVN